MLEAFMHFLNFTGEKQRMLKGKVTYSNHVIKGNIDDFTDMLRLAARYIHPGLCHYLVRVEI